MQAVGIKHTKPEWMVRRLLHSLGYRYRLHCKNLPGKPDIVFPGRKKVIFVHGCFWHAHECQKGRAPKSKLEYWESKLAANKARDARKEAELRELGWQTLAVWQCELSNREALEAALTNFLGPPRKTIDRSRETT
jgi:DNA mismatch endonuclease (patch repair protein)